jgi:hypothetical protein
MLLACLFFIIIWAIQRICKYQDLVAAIFCRKGQFEGFKSKDFLKKKTYEDAMRYW